MVELAAHAFQEHVTGNAIFFGFAQLYTDFQRQLGVFACELEVALALFTEVEEGVDTGEDADYKHQGSDDKGVDVAHLSEAGCNQGNDGGGDSEQNVQAFLGVTCLFVLRGSAVALVLDRQQQSFLSGLPQQFLSVAVIEAAIWTVACIIITRGKWLG